MNRDDLCPKDTIFAEDKRYELQRYGKMDAVLHHKAFTI